MFSCLVGMVRGLRQLLLVAIAATFALAGCDTNEGPGEEMGETLDEAGEEVQDAADETGDAVEDPDT